MRIFAWALMFTLAAVPFAGIIALAFISAKSRRYSVNERYMRLVRRQGDDVLAGRDTRDEVFRQRERWYGRIPK